MTVTSEYDVALYLSDIHHFFEAPPLDPFAGDSIDESGIDQLMDTMKARTRGALKPGADRAAPAPEQIAPDLVPRLKAAIATYCNVQKRLRRRSARRGRGPARLDRLHRLGRLPAALDAVGTGVREPGTPGAPPVRRGLSLSPAGSACGGRPNCCSTTGGRSPAT